MTTFEGTTFRDLTLAEAAQFALDVQTASNLSGVVRSMARCTETLWRQPGMDTATLNRHPIMYLFAVQVAHLTGVSCEGSANYAQAHHRCEQLAQGDSVRAVSVSE